MSIVERLRLLCSDCILAPQNRNVEEDDLRPCCIKCDGKWEAAAEIERLLAIVGRLPTTSDGVPITPGMIVFGGWDGIGVVSELETSGAYIRQPGGVFWRAMDECYSTEEAAHKR